ncbi:MULTISPECIES: SMI1/KNR4 family protein [Tsukamurella]|uniref:SMI1/KNR4 family protein n=1 Tax=Tsukamurella strandjordii TaxID=147577 RepID=A0AA90SIA4_9ACTN|nr:MULTISPECIES: SMI1/KNR4 family protein [Tsukamurella]MDP0399819.1 SMI1/KNR4 family protein [Tsukamurella strandjordii]GIZ97418.1 hypothetical protein TTY48_20300 [Tsukamurella sp. TY48]
MEAISRLLEIVPPPAEPPSPQDWQAAEAQLGSPLPDDYKDFIGTYGPGSFWGELNIAPPLWIANERGKSPGAVNFLHDISEERPDYVDVAGNGAGSFDEIYGDRDDSYLWLGFSGTGQNLFWRTTAPDPNSWPVVVTDNASIDYEAGGIVAYLVELLSGRFPSAAFDAEWLDEVQGEGRSPFTRVEYNPES